MSSIKSPGTCIAAILAVLAICTIATEARENEDQQRASFVCDECAEKGDAVALAYCLGWMAGVNNYQGALEESKNMKQLYCVPGGAQIEDVRRIFVKYCDEHPEVRPYRAASALIVSLVHAYPCDKQLNR